MDFLPLVDPVPKSFTFLNLQITPRIEPPTVRSKHLMVDIIPAFPSLCGGWFWLKGSLEESLVVEGRFLNLSVVGTATPSADVSLSVRFEYRCNRVLSLERGRDMSMPRRCGGFYKITSPDIYGPNSLVTISIYCDELSSASYIL